MKQILKVVVIIVSLLMFGPKIVNDYVVFSTKEQILNIEEVKALDDVDCIIILGAGAWGDRPSPLLKDRLEKGIELYEKEVSPKIVMSGDHGHAAYDEVNVMKDYALQEDVPSSDVFMDHAGFSTYDSMYRAKHIFNAKKVVIVTQEYHLYRALYIAKRLNLEAYGVAAIENNYPGQDYRDTREFLARNKDFVKVIFKPKSTYVGEEISLLGDGDITNDR